MKVLYHFRTQGTGAEGVHIAGIATALEGLGHEVIFSSPTGVDPRATAGANPFSQRKRGLLARVAAKAPGIVFECLELAYNAVAWLRNGRLLAEERCGLIYERHAFFLCSTALLAARRGVPLVVEVNELVGDERIRPEPWLAPLARWSDRITFTRASLIVVVSPHLQRRIATMGIVPEKILVLPNAVSESAMDAPADGAAVRARLGLGDAIVIGFVGWFVAWHRLDVLLAQFAALASAHPRARLLLVGDGVLRGALVEQAAQLGIGERIVFAGSAPHSEIPAHIAAMDICVVPHSNEFRSPIKLFECMARARAVVAPSTEPIAMVLRDGENGLLFDPEKPATLGAALARLIADEPLRTRLGQQAQADVRARHTWRHNAEAVLARVRAGDE